MVYLFCALIVIALLISWKYILRLEPAGIFAALWIFFAVSALLLQNYIDLRFDGCTFILAGVIFFVAGTIFSDYFFRPTPSETKWELRKKWVTPLLIILLVGAMVNPLYSIILHGFSLRALLDMREVLEMNKGISEDRYAGAEAHDVVNQFFLIFSYAAPVIGGLCFRLVGKWNKVLCILTLIPCTFIALTQSLKMGMIASFILFFAAYIVCSYTYGLPIRMKGKIILRFVLVIAGFHLDFVQFFPTVDAFPVNAGWAELVLLSHAAGIHPKVISFRAALFLSVRNQGFILNAFWVNTCHIFNKIRILIVHLSSLFEHGILFFTILCDSLLEGINFIE